MIQSSAAKLFDIVLTWMFFHLLPADGVDSSIRFKARSRSTGVRREAHLAAIVSTIVLTVALDSINHHVL